MKRGPVWTLAASVRAVARGAAAGGALAIILRGSRSAAPSFASNSYLGLTLTGEIPEAPAPTEIGTLFENRPPSLRTIVESLDRAAEDARIRAVVLRVSALPGAGWGKIQELRDALARFRKSGKPAYAHLELCGNKEYYL